MHKNLLPLAESQGRSSLPPKMDLSFEFEIWCERGLNSVGDFFKNPFSTPAMRGRSRNSIEGSEPKENLDMNPFTQTSLPHLDLISFSLSGPPGRPATTSPLPALLPPTVALLQPPNSG